MAPTICTEKKRNQIRSSSSSSNNLKDMRRHARNLQLPAATSSTIMNFVVKGTLNARSTLRLQQRGESSNSNKRRANADEREESNSDSANSSRDATQTQQLILRQHQSQISDNAVTSSTHIEDNHDGSSSASTSSDCNSGAVIIAYQPRRTRSAHDVDNSNRSNNSNNYQYSNETMDTDEEDIEVHSIINAKTNANGHASYMIDDDNAAYAAGDTVDSTNRLLSCTLYKPKLSDKQLSSISSSSNHNNSKTYSNMCEIKNSEGLLSIAIKTIKLVKRNQMLQRRLAQLQLETTEFIQSVLANPENRHFREKIKQTGSSSGGGASAKVDQLEWTGQHVAGI